MQIRALQDCFSVRASWFLEADVSDEAAVTGAAAEVDAAWGRVDALINNAGWMPGRQPVLELELSVLERVLRSNLIGSFLATKHFAPLMIRAARLARRIRTPRPAAARFGLTDGFLGRRQVDDLA